MSHHAMQIHERHLSMRAIRLKRVRVPTHPTTRNEHNRARLPHGSPASASRRWGRVFLMANAVTFPFIGCVYDGDQPCGPGQTLKTNSEYSAICVCAEG